MSLPIFPPFILVPLVVFACCLLSAGIGILLTRAQYKKRKLLKTRIIIALSVVGIITLYFIFYTVSNLIGRNSARAEWENTQKVWGITNLNQLIPKPPKNKSENAVYLYHAAIALLKSADFDMEYYNSIKDVKQHLRYPGWENKDKAKLIKLAKNRNLLQALALFQKGASKNTAVNIRNYNGIQTLLPNLSSYRSLFRMAVLESNVLAMEGKHDDAYKILLDGFKFIYQFRNEPTLLDHLVYIACIWIDLQTLNHQVLNSGIDNNNAYKILAVLNKLDFRKATRTGIAGEIMMYRDFVEKFTKDDPIWPEVFNVKKSFWQTTFVKFYPFFYQGWANYLKLTTTFRKTFDKPFYQCNKELDDFKKELASGYKFAKWFMPNFIAVRTKVANINSDINATKIILALHIYRNDHGQFPENLNLLAPKILEKVDVDPISGKPLNYKKEGNYFKLTGFYSEKRFFPNDSKKTPRQ
jgi:hypothetical protein